MRTTLELPDPLFKHLKTMAAIEGITLRELVVNVLERGLQAPTTVESIPSRLPSVSLGAPMALAVTEFSNASLASFVDE
jgi:predicted DNA-binding ribbon-helix-helix protein